MPVSCMYVCVAFIALYCIQVFIWRSSTAKGKQRRFWFDYMLLQEKRHVLRSDKDVERLDDRREARAEGGRRFQTEGAITAKDLDMAMVVLARGTKSSRLSMERRGRRDVAEVGSRMTSRRYLGATPIWALRTISKLYSQCE